MIENLDDIPNIHANVGAAIEHDWPDMCKVVVSHINALEVKLAAAEAENERLRHAGAGDMRDVREAAERQPAITEERGEFLMIESGDWVWCPSGYGHGCFTSQQLRWLSDELVRRSGT